MKKYFIIVILLFYKVSIAQSTFDYNVQLTPIIIPSLQGLHSYAFAQHNGKWLIIGGRKDGVHARQPFNAFPNEQNNSNIIVIDVATQQFWSASLTSLSIGLKEQLQSTNMNFYQDGDTLYIIGGYAFSESLNDHVTFDKLTSIDVPNLINAVVNGTSISSNFKQIANPIFQNTGGQLGKIGNEFYLVGGQIFTGRYNPMNNPTFVQSYVNKVQKFMIDNSGTQLSYTNYSFVEDVVHLHRRDYNLIPQVFPNGEEGYTISSGVFQINVDLPFLYPVDIKASGYFPQTQFNQYLSNYHSAKVGLYDGIDNKMHNLFFGGISRYYYNGTTLVQDDDVPFVKTISRTTRVANGDLSEYKLEVEMPNLKGAGAEFIPNKNLPHYSNEVIKLNDITSNEFVIGHIYGGIDSVSINPFTNNQTNTTSAGATIYEVKLIKNATLGQSSIEGKNEFTFTVSPNPTSNDSLSIQFNLPYVATLDYFVTNVNGQLLDDGEIDGLKQGNNSMTFNLVNSENKIQFITFILDNKFYCTQKVIMK